MAPSSLQTLVQPSNVHHDLASLPPEILSHIRICLRELDEPYHDKPDRYDYHPNTSFPLVCRRFRDLELSIPSLWTLLTDDMTTDRINLHIAHSGALGLKVRLSIDGWPECRCEKWRLLARSSHRWAILSIDAHEDQHNCFSTLVGLYLPSLWNLNITGIDEDVIPILSTWTVPSVRVVDSSKLSALLALPITRPLMTLRLTHQCATFDVDGLLDFLESAKASQLTNLNLSLFRLSLRGGLPWRYKKLTLPMLQDLSLRCLVKARVFEQTVLQLMRCITVPNIRFVTLMLTKDIADNDTFIDWFRSLRNPSLHAVTVRIVGDLDGTSQRRIVDAFQGNDGFVFQAETSIDVFGVHILKIRARKESNST